MTRPNDGQNPPKAAPGGIRAAHKEMAAAKKKAAPPKAPAKKAKSNVVQIGERTPAKKVAAPKASREAVPKEPQDAEHPWYTKKSYTAVPGQKLYEAIGESGQIAVRSCAKPMTHAVSWAHVDQPGERAKAIREGVIVNLYDSEAAAEKAAERFRKDNPLDRIVVVPAKEYNGQ